MIEFHPDPLFVSGEDRSKKYQLRDVKYLTVSVTTAVSGGGRE